MDQVRIDVGRRAAGLAYAAALRKLGLDPEALFWARDDLSNELILVLVTRFFDHVGPLALSELLFKAYNAAGTPKEIDPFIVDLHSPNHHMIRSVKESLDKFKEQIVDTGKLKSPDMTGAFLSTGTISIPLEEIYFWKDSRGPGVDLVRRWNFFERKVEALAA